MNRTGWQIAWTLVAAACAGGPVPGDTPGMLPFRVEELPEIAPPDPARAELGRLLFYDPILSVDHETACASCHSEVWGMGDGLPVSIGHGAGLLSGPGRKGGALLRRNAPSLYNLAFRTSLFWDGRSPSLEAQALEPLRNPDEMGLSPAEAVRALSANREYVQLFEQAFPDNPAPSEAHLETALAAFQRTLVSLNSLYDSYVAGDRWAISDEHVAGMQRFAAFGCAECHAPPLFGGEGFSARGVSDSAAEPDLGRYEVTGRTGDLGAFRIPSLRNLAFTEPYFHDGSVVHLEDAVHDELARSGLPFDAQDTAFIANFLSDALRDESHEPDRPDRVPSNLPVPLDGTFLDR